MPIHQYANFFGTRFPAYGLCVGIGLLVIGIWMLRSFKKFRMDGDEQNEILFGFPFMVLAGVFCAFALDAYFTGDWRTWTSPTVRRFGFTFTGWLLGASAFLAVYGRFASFGSLFLLDMFLPSFALAQAIGRIGCFFGGCCYGIPCRLGVRYPVGSLPYSAVGDTALLPIQLYEAFALLLLFAFCARAPFRWRAAIYLCGVAIVRFVAECFRHDPRGTALGIECFSPQQLMSMLFMLMAIVVLWAESRFPVRANSRKRQVGKMT